MYTSEITQEILAKSVIAVPPLARDADFNIDPIENQKIIQHIEAGGVTTLLYGGNANLYHIKPMEYVELLAVLESFSHEKTLVVPSVGPSYGLMMEQAEALRDFQYPTAMVLPQRDIVTQRGIASGVRRFVDVFGKPAVLYIKFDNWLDVPTVKKLVDDGCVSFIKYAIVKDNPADDDYLKELVSEVDPGLIVSGIGEQPAIIHMRDFGLVGYTSGCVCIAPGLSQRMLSTIQRSDFETAEKIRSTFEPLENLRNEINPIRVLHNAVTAAGIANTGPMLPLLSEADERLEEIKTAAEALLMAANQ
jgi:dihydrodipicolinate synthase/N-acetylneuraminate lyase